MFVDAVNNVGMKTRYCTKCGETKHVFEFAKNSSKKSGFSSHCKACMNVYFSLKKDSKKAYDAVYKLANREKRRLQSVKRYANNPDKVLACTKAWQKANPDKVKAAKTAWNANNRESTRMYWQNRRARKLESGGKLSNGLAAKLFKLQRGKCACGCKQPLGDDYHLDHCMPLALGGSNTDENMQLLRKLCNLQKSAKHPVDFMQQRGFLL